MARRTTTDQEERPTATPYASQAATEYASPVATVATPAETAYSVDPEAYGSLTTEQLEPEPTPPGESHVAGITEPGIAVKMELPTETALEVRVVQKALGLQTRAEAVAAAVSITTSLLNEVRRGGTVYVESKTGSRFKLVLRKIDDV